MLSMRKENKHDVREQRLDNIDKSTFMVFNSKWGQSGATRVPCCWCRDGVHGDEPLATQTWWLSACLLYKTQQSLWNKDIVLERLLCVVFAVAQMKLIKRSPAKRAQWSWKETAQINPEMTKQRSHISAFIAPLLAPITNWKVPS